jgi:hypothetical protein
MVLPELKPPSRYLELLWGYGYTRILDEANKYRTPANFSTMHAFAHNLVLRKPM